MLKKDNYSLISAIYTEISHIWWVCRIFIQFCICFYDSNVPRACGSL